MKIFNLLPKKNPILIKRKTSKEKDQFIPSVYHKLTFSGVFSDFHDLVLAFIFRCYSICFSMELFHKEIMQFKEICEKNQYDNKFFDRYLGIFSNKICFKKGPQHRVP